MVYIAVVAVAAIVAQTLLAFDARRRRDVERSLEQARVDALISRVQAGSLEQYHAIVAEPPKDVNLGTWVHDDTGLISVRGDEQ
jgi:hypothetical protein